MKLALAFRWVRLRPFDTSSENGRTQERYRVAAISILASVVSRGLSMFAMVLGVSLTTPYLGPERFGIWMTIASLTAMLSLLDLGTSNALTNQVARVAANEDAVALRQAVSGGLTFITLIGTVTSTGLFAIASWLDWGRLLKLTDPQVASEARQAAMVFSLLFGLNAAATGVQKVLSGLQRGYEAHVASSIGALLVIATLFVATSRQASVPELLLATSGVQIVCALAPLALLVLRGQFALRGVFEATAREAKQLLGVSLLFFLLQIGTMVGWGADALIISTKLGASQVAAYSLCDRLFQFVAIPLAMVNAPLWAAYADAQARTDRAFVRRTLRRSLSLTFVLAITGTIAMWFAAPTLVERWAHGSIRVDSLLLGSFAVWCVLNSTGNAFAMFLNGTGIVRAQVISVGLFCLLATPLKLILLPEFGAAGLLMATIACYLVAVPLLYGSLLRKHVSEAICINPPDNQRS